MSVSTVCTICESAIAVQHCNRCGANVCRDHYNNDARLCQACASGGGIR